jgi:hypothetical protein
MQSVPEINEPAVELRPMTAGREVVEDYGHVGLTLRTHPIAFLREDLQQRHIVTCSAAMNDIRDGRWAEVAGLVLVRQRPGSAKGVMFITIEDESGIANRTRGCVPVAAWPGRSGPRRLRAGRARSARSWIEGPASARHLRSRAPYRYNQGEIAKLSVMPSRNQNQPSAVAIP